ncbi:iron-sulfur cluster-binding domain-containing protein [Lentisphaera profundi]|uniref:Iron-sulfur cluster-binding domain-containing protein n=1 Tax=Lentisphaera profundi TaxID=1658616 RepID=A0ABY7VX22_9BACT|nr:iron-sulfur cluster-binding domain-containing protein [Lentisphaera profundi]WDE98461.1 iron-sulfur cluster-binding domain-containing protein [Lentisphaera profundi]
MFNFDSWPLEQLQAYALLLSIFTFIIVLVFLMRELGATQEIDSSDKQDLILVGPPKSTGNITQMEVLHIRQLTPTIKNFRLRPLEQYVDYDPGQFLTFHTGETQKVARCYSLNSSPSRPGIYEVSIKLIKNGLGSTWMHEQVKAGDILKVSNPAGRFAYEADDKVSIFVAGGVGITPMMSMIKYAVDKGHSQPIYFFYSARTIDEMAFHDELKIISTMSSAIHYIPILSQPPENWDGESGRLNDEVIAKYKIDFPNATLYTCGPAPLMESVKTMALNQGMPENKFHNEIFASPASEKRDKIACEISVNGQHYQYNDNITLLNFLEQQQVPIKSSCRAGVCGICMVKIKKGKVTSLPSDYLDEEDKKTGACLSCISFPKTKLEIELDDDV